MVMEIAKTIASRVAERRAEKGWSTRELDRRAGLTQGHTYLVEKGERERIEVETLAKLAAALGVTVDWLLGTPPSGRNLSSRGRASTGNARHVQNTRTAAPGARKRAS